MTNKEIILDLWKQVKRPGIEKLIKWLEESDFFESPCSTKFHLAEQGGLAEHSLNTYRLLIEKVMKYKLEELIPIDEVIVTALGHDLCKVGVYSKDKTIATDKQLDYLKKLCNADEFEKHKVEGLTKSYVSQLIDWYKGGKKGNNPDNGYTFTENLPLGHGEKSISILQRFIELTEKELLAIRWHMSLMDVSVQLGGYPTKYAYEDAIKKYVLVQLFMLVDFEASLLIEKKWEN